MSEYSCENCGAVDPVQGASECLLCELYITKIALGEKQAALDRLMLEFCPEDMTEEQLSEWAKHQVVVDDKIVNNITGALRSTVDAHGNRVEGSWIGSAVKRILGSILSRR